MTGCSTSAALRWVAMVTAMRMADCMFSAPARFFAGDVEGGAVVDGGADDGDAEAHVDGGVERDELHGDVALIVIHGDDEVVGAVGSAEEDGVGGDGAFAVDALGAAGFDGRPDEEFVFFAETGRARRRGG